MNAILTGTAGAEAWGLALSTSGYVAIDTIGQWAGMATRVPRGDQTGSPRHLDIIAVTGPGVVRFDPKMVSLSTDTELDTPGYGGCPRANRRGQIAPFSADALTTNTQTISSWCGSARQPPGQLARSDQPSCAGRWGTSLVTRRGRKSMPSVPQPGGSWPASPRGCMMWGTPQPLWRQT